MYRLETAFPSIVIVLSSLSLLDLMNQINVLSTINSAIGICGGILYFLHKTSYRHFISIWIYAQFIIITKVVVDANGTEFEFPILDLSQIFKVHMNLSLQFGNTSYLAGFNFLPVLYIAVFKGLQLANLEGRELLIRLYRNSEVLDEILPQTGKVIKRVRFKGDRNWLLIQLENPITLNSEAFPFAIIKNREDNPIRIGKKRQAASLRVVSSIETIKIDSSPGDFELIDWVFVE